MTLETRAVGFRINGRRLLSAVDFRAAPGALTALVGANGAGKSTLLRLLSGEMTPDGGRISLDGRPLSAYRRAEIARRRAVVTQHADRDCPLTVDQLVELGRLPWGPPRRDPEGGRIVAAALVAADAADLRGRAYPTLSGGERQRVHLARALAQVGYPDDLAGRWLLLDEATAHMDVAVELATHTLLRRLADQGLGIVAVLHDLSAAARADHVVMLGAGRVLAAGPPAEVLVPTTIRAAFAVAAERLSDSVGGIAFSYRPIAPGTAEPHRSGVAGA